MARYAVIRTAKQHRSFIWSELEQGRLRQGWGWSDEQDLRLIHRKRDAGELLADDERAAWRNRRMLADVWDGLQDGDVVISPNLPEQGQWIIARVSGAYRFQIPDGQPDFGHILPVSPLRSSDGKIAIVNSRDASVDARLRGTMRNMSRMWSIDYLGRAVDEIIAAIEAGKDVSAGQTADQRRAIFLDEVRGEVTDLVWSRLHKSYHGAELEHLLISLLESIYGKGNVEHHGGAGEKGADLIVTMQGPFALKFKTAIQVKMYDGTQYDMRPIDQLRWAREEHGVQAGVVLTTAKEVSQEFQDALVQLGEELKIDIQVWVRDDFVRLLLTHLGRRERA